LWYRLRGMSRLLFIPIGVLYAFLSISPPVLAIVADRILAVVNGQVIAKSDVQIYREVFAAKSTADDSAVLHELVDQELLLEEAKKLEILPPTDEEIAQAYNNLRLRFGRPETFALLKARLSLTDEEIELEIRQQLLIQKLIEQRINYFVFVTPGEVEGYAQEHSAEFKDSTTEAARKEIQEILTAQKAKQKLKDYLDRLRVKADIRINRPLSE
jgi:foldase protein PrsA